MRRIAFVLVLTLVGCNNATSSSGAPPSGGVQPVPVPVPQPVPVAPPPQPVPVNPAQPFPVPGFNPGTPSTPPAPPTTRRVPTDAELCRVWPRRCEESCVRAFHDADRRCTRLPQRQQSQAEITALAHCFAGCPPHHDTQACVGQPTREACECGMRCMRRLLPADQLAAMIPYGECMLPLVEAACN